MAIIQVHKVISGAFYTKDGEKIGELKPDSYTVQALEDFSEEKLGEKSSSEN